MNLIPPTISQAQLETARELVTKLLPEALENLGELVRIPGIAWEAFDASELDKSAEAVRRLFASGGVFDQVEILTAEYDGGKVGAPAIVARRDARNQKPTVLLYAHHDVQPPGDRASWTTDPFEPTQLGDRIFARGVADDKAGIIAHYVATKLLGEILGSDFDLGLVIFIEGEEEAGSPSFSNFLNQYREKLESDVIVVADSGNWSTSVPAITTSLRGLVSLEFEVKTLDHAVHSGMFGGAVPDAMTAMIKILSSMWDEKGEVTISGLNSAENSVLDLSLGQLREDSGLLPSTSTIGSGSIVSRLWSKPALTLIGLDYPSVALSSNTLMPSLRAKLSLRIAPGDVPERALEALKSHIQANNAFGAAITFGAVELGKPFKMGDSGWAKALMSQALGLSYDNDSVEIGIGGSIPFIAEFERVFPAAQVLVTGIEDPDSRAHSPNESLHLGTFEAAMLAELLFLLGGNQIGLDQV